MGWNYSMGSKKPKDKLRKEINIDVTKKHIVGFVLFIFVVVFLIALALEHSGVFEEELSFGCIDGEEEKIKEGVEFYCGEHYSVIQDKVSPEQYQKIEEIIYGKVQE